MYITSVTDETGTIVDDLNTALLDIENKFIAEVSTDTSPIASTILQIAEIFSDLDEDVDYKRANEDVIQ
jgi:hypothetical protein